MHRPRSLWFATFAWASAGCGTSDPGGVGAADAAADTDASAEAALPCGAPSVLATAGRSPDGVLTNFPEFRFVKTGGTLDITTAYFDLARLPGLDSLVAYGDLENRTRTQQCIPAADQFDVGSQGVLTVVDGPAYELPGSRIPIVCFEPGARGVFRSIQNNVDPTLLTVPVTVSYAFSTLVLTPSSRRHPDDPRVVSASVTAGEAGWTLNGQMRAGEGDIHALESRFYVRDPNGLLYNYLQAQPGALRTIPARSTFPFESEPNRAEYCAYEIFDVFSDGPEPPGDGGPIESGAEPSD